MDTCIPVNNAPVVCKTMNLTLAVDHKVANGAYAAQFFEFLKKSLEDMATFSP
jgi:pyruvate/2-oxoglutarate dehydrogenase complex dihydrolipoamide acyltransferase (E2) component